jgi:hypothetical protein
MTENHDTEGPRAPIDSRATLAQAVAAYADLARTSLSEQPLDAALGRIAHIAARVVPGADEVSVTVLEHGRARSAAFTGPLAIALDERQYQDGSGPCMDAAVTGQLISIEDTAQPGAYPHLRREAERNGIGHTLSIGMATLPDTAASLNIYGAGPGGPFSRLAQDIATTLASYGAIAVLHADPDAAGQTRQRHRALASRAVVEQAKGMLMWDQRCSAEEAFALLRQESLRSHRPLRDVAAAIVETAAD